MRTLTLHSILAILLAVGTAAHAAPALDREVALARFHAAVEAARARPPRPAPAVRQARLQLAVQRQLLTAAEASAFVEAFAQGDDALVAVSKQILANPAATALASVLAAGAAEAEEPDGSADSGGGPTPGEVFDAALEGALEGLGTGSLFGAAFGNPSLGGAIGAIVGAIAGAIDALFGGGGEEEGDGGDNGDTGGDGGDNGDTGGGDTGGGGDSGGSGSGGSGG